MEQNSRCIVCSKARSFSSSLNSQEENLGGNFCENNGDSTQKILIAAFIECLGGDKISVEKYFGGHEGKIPTIWFCPRCEKYLSEWNQVMTQVSWLLERANTIKFSLLSWILLAKTGNNEKNESFQVEDITESDGLNQSRTLLEHQIDVLNESIKNEYFASVRLEKISSSNLECLEISDDEPMELKNHIQESDSDYEPVNDADDDDVKETENPCAAKSVPATYANENLKENKHGSLFPTVKLGPNEFSYGPKYKFFYRDGIYHCEECSAKFATKRGQVTRHIREVHMKLKTPREKRDKMKKEKMPRSRPKVTNEPRIESGEIFYAEKYKITIKDFKYHCDLCPVVYNQKNRMFQHIKDVHVDPKDRTYGVNNALKPMESDPTILLYRGKIQVRTDNEGKFYCSVCEYQTSNRRFIVIHLRKNHTGKKSSSGSKRRGSPMTEVAPNQFLCYNKYPFKYLETEKLYACGLCDHTHSNLKSIFPHMRTTHFTDEDKSLFTAVQIGESEFEYLGKYRFKLQPSDGHYYCQICQRSTDSSEGMYQHIRRSHVNESGSPGGAKIKTENPEMRPPARTKYEYRGIAYNYDSAQGKYVCSSCQHGLTVRSSMMEHIKTRHGDESRSFICHICGDVLNSQRCLRQHLKRHGRGILTCSYCAKKFRDRRNFRSHLALHEKGDEMKKHQCEYCGKRFVVKQHLEKHVRIHTGEKPFKCDLCDEMFADSAKRHYHKKTIHGISAPMKIVE